MAFDDTEGARTLLDDYKNHVSINCFDPSETPSAAKHFLYARCGDVSFIVGGDEMQVVGQKGRFTETEIESAYAKWCTYWKAYWELRDTEGALPEDYACEVTIPISGD